MKYLTKFTIFSYFLVAERRKTSEHKIETQTRDIESELQHEIIDELNIIKATSLYLKFEVWTGEEVGIWEELKSPLI